MDIDILKRLQEAQEWLQKEYAGIRSGQSSPALLDGISVESYGARMPLNQVGSIGIEDARTLRVSPWDSSLVQTIEKAIRDADLGVSVVADSSGLRVIFPELTAERRTQLLKLAKSKLEDARITVRSVRDDFMKQMEKSFKEGDISEDEKFVIKEKIQKAVDGMNTTLEEIYYKKEAELQK